MTKNIEKNDEKTNNSTQILTKNSNSSTKGKGLFQPKIRSVSDDRFFTF